MMTTCQRCLSIISTRFPLHDCDRLLRERQEFDAQTKRDEQAAPWRIGDPAIEHDPPAERASIPEACKWAEATNEQTLCCLCEKQNCGPTEATYLVVGQRWHHGYNRLVVFNGYVCEMHMAEDCSGCRVIKHDPAGFEKQSNR